MAIWKTFANEQGTSRTEFTIEDWDGIQNWAIKKIIRHTHSAIPARHVEIWNSTDTSAPVGLSTTGRENLTWQDHVSLDHSANFSTGQLLARGWTVPIRTRFVITTPIYDTTSPVPFPTYNMSYIGINKSLSSTDMTELISTNRHNPNTYSNYRHYLYALPQNAICKIHPSHTPLLTGDVATAVFAKTPLFIHPSNTKFLQDIAETSETPNFRGMGFIPDYAQEKIWSLTEDSTCWLGGYRSFVAGKGNDIMLFFNDYYNEFNQILSILNYEEKNREPFFRWEKGAGNLTSLDYHSLSDLTRLMESKTIDVGEVSVSGGLVRDAINKKFSPFLTNDYKFKIDKTTNRLKQTLLESCIEKSGNAITFYQKGLYNFASLNSDDYIQDLKVPEYFEDGYRQCLIMTGELGTSKKSFKRLHKGRVELVYQIVDGYLSVPYEVYSIPSTARITSGDGSTPLRGSITDKNYTDVTRLSEPNTPGFPNN